MNMPTPARAASNSMGANMIALARGLCAFRGAQELVLQLFRWAQLPVKVMNLLTGMVR
jgi:hypothetical protein